MRLTLGCWNPWKRIGTKMDSRQYSFTPSIELLKELKCITAKEKLDWLEEANNFFSQFLTIEDIERYKKIRDRVYRHEP